MKLLCVLYFPEFEAEIHAFHIKFTDIEVWMIGVARSVNRMTVGAPEHQRFVASHLPESRVHVLELHELAKAIEAKAAAAMSELISYG